MLGRNSLVQRVMSGAVAMSFAWCRHGARVRFPLFFTHFSLGVLGFLVYTLGFRGGALCNSYFSMGWQGRI